MSPHLQTSSASTASSAPATNSVPVAPLPSPAELQAEYPLSEFACEQIELARRSIGGRIERGEGAPVAIVGPCSVHCETAALEYAERLLHVKKRLEGRVQVVMRVYFEKPRTTVGWKGFLYDPDLDGSSDLARGLSRARALLVRIAEMGLPVASEILDPIAAVYLADCMSWVAIGARTSESQIHRQMASGLDCPVGFKNGTDGSVKVAVQAIESARSSHTHLGIDAEGRVASLRSEGNAGAHVVLRGGATGPNFDEKSVNEAAGQLESNSLRGSVIVDCSHGNSEKDYTRQPAVARAVMEQLPTERVAGLMIESHLTSGKQSLDPKEGARESLQYGVSVTDGCVDFSTTEGLLMEMAGAS